MPVEIAENKTKEVGKHGIACVTLAKSLKEAVADPWQTLIARQQ